MLLQSLVGFFLAILLFFVVLRLRPERPLAIWSNGLIIAAVIYLIFALIGQQYDWLVIEFSGILLYLIPVVLSFKYSKYWLAAGWALHVLWDILLHPAGHPGFVPSWYPGVCLGFDLAIAGAIIWWLMRNTVENSNQVAIEE